MGTREITEAEKALAYIVEKFNEGNYGKAPENSHTFSVERGGERPPALRDETPLSGDYSLALTMGKSKEYGTLPSDQHKLRKSLEADGIPIPTFTGWYGSANTFYIPLDNGVEANILAVATQLGYQSDLVIGSDRPDSSIDGGGVSARSEERGRGGRK